MALAHGPGYRGCAFPTVGWQSPIYIEVGSDLKVQRVKEEAVPFVVRFVKAMMGEAVADPAQVIVTPNKDIEPVPLQDTDEPVVVLFIWD